MWENIIFDLYLLEWFDGIFITANSNIPLLLPVAGLEWDCDWPVPVDGPSGPR